MKKVGKFLLCFVPLILMLFINVVVSYVALFFIAFKDAATGNVAASTPEAVTEYVEQLITNPEFLLQATVIFQFVCLFVAAIVYGLGMKKGRIKKDTHKVNGFAISGILFLFAGASLFVTLFMEGVSVLLPEVMEKYAEMMESSGLTEMSLISTIATLVLAPLAEEIVFRGITFKFARSFSKKFWIANCIQALAFGIAHLNIVQGTYAFALGLLLGYLYKKYNTLIAPMLGHCVFNFAGTYLTTFVYGDSEELSTMKLLSIVGLTAVLMGLGIVLLVKDKNKKDNEEAFMARWRRETFKKPAQPVAQPQVATAYNTVTETVNTPANATSANPYGPGTPYVPNGTAEEKKPENSENVFDKY